MMCACTPLSHKHCRIKTVEVPVRARQQEEQGAVDHLKVKIVFLTAPPEHQGVRQQQLACALVDRS